MITSPAFAASTTLKPLPVDPARHTLQIENYGLWDHMHGAAATMPLLVMDVYEHSYRMDFGPATAKYVDAFFRNIHWEAVLARLDSASRSTRK